MKTDVSTELARERRIPPYLTFIKKDPHANMRVRLEGLGIEPRPQRFPASRSDCQADVLSLVFGGRRCRPFCALTIMLSPHGKRSCGYDSLLFHKQQPRHQSHASENSPELYERLAGVFRLVQFWHEVGPCDINKIACREGDYVFRSPLYGRTGNKGSRGSCNCNEARIEVIEECFAFTVTRVEQYSQVAHLVRYLVEDDGDRRCNARRHTYKPAGGDNRAVQEVVHAACD